MGTSVGKAIDYLVAALPAPVAAADATAVVVDGYPETYSESMLVVGRESETVAVSADGERNAVELGLGTTDEEYQIPCHIVVNRPGPAMKPARDAAVAIFDAVAHTIAADRTLGGVLMAGRWAEIQKVSILQDVNDTSNGGAGMLRVVFITFDIKCTNHYQP